MNRTIRISPFLRCLLLVLAVAFAAGGPVRAQTAAGDYPIGTSPAQRSAAILMMREKSFEIKDVYWTEKNTLNIYVVDHNRSVLHLAQYACSVAARFGVAENLFVYVYDDIRVSYFVQEGYLKLRGCFPWD